MGRPIEPRQIEVHDLDGELIAAALYDRLGVETLVAAILADCGIAPADSPLAPGWSTQRRGPLDGVTRDRVRARAATRLAARSRRPRCAF